MIIPCQNMSLCLQLLSEPNNLPQPPCWSICFPIYSEDIQVMVAATATAVKNDCESFFFFFFSHIYGIHKNTGSSQRYSHRLQVHR